MKSFAPGGDGTLTTTTSNADQSVALRSLIMAAIKGHAACRFDHRPEFLDKGFEMITALRGHYAPTGKVATFVKFRGLVDLEMKDDEPVGTFLARVQDSESDLHEGGLDLDPTLITLFVLKRLSNKFQPIHQTFYIHSEKYGQLDVDKIQDQCVA